MKHTVLFFRLSYAVLVQQSFDAGQVFDSISTSIDAAQTHSYETLRNHGCWCPRLLRYSTARGTSVNSVDDLCRDWLTLRQEIAKKECKQVYSHHDFMYKVDLKSENGATELHPTADEHCAPIINMGISQLKRCLLILCRVDYVHLSEILQSYDGNPTYETCAVDNSIIEGNEGFLEIKRRVCLTSDTYPFMECHMENDVEAIAAATAARRAPVLEKNASNDRATHFLAWINNHNG